MISFSIELEICKGHTLEFDIDAAIDPGEAMSHDCPGGSASVDEIYIKYNGHDCTDTLDKRLYAICMECAEDELSNWSPEDGE